MNNIFSIPILIISFAFLSAVDCASNGAGEWQILTNLNYSSHIRLHPHTLLFVTVLWCGQSRSLMRELSRSVADKKMEFDSLKLMFIHRNTEKVFADSIGASYGITNADSPEELPLKPLNSQEDLKSFLEATDKALILAEFCGWAPKLLA
ncbi:hypothetical protein F3Y22_tig00110597pilonHSYRG00287 [Hibiscus syriacus]|uniref:Uncharacterized protein n=1 Tax=Hibiscus syriacus TaxID=106335 RepID=A0A6A3A2H1_HIBSY|nr:hypothetical protein F3Y22_tig00110597pilonHSYRG00287 [Hibiscus syriacus]